MRYTRSLIPTLLLAASASLVAQSNTSGLSGTIIDPSGAVIPGASVTLVNSATGLIKTEKSEAKGEYSFDQVPPGTYLVTISAPGFADQVQKVDLLISTPLKINFKMTLGNTEVVNVEATTATINATDGSLGKPFDTKMVQDLPYIANNVLSLLALQPGVISLGPNSNSNAAGSINGARNDQTNITVDGVDNNDPNGGQSAGVNSTVGLPFTGSLRSTRESIQEFRVTTTNGNADSGRSSGAQVSLQTKSGSNSIHGAAYEYYRDPALASNDWFTKQTQVGSNQPNISKKVLQHTYGASLGLPIIKNKLFFFGAYEGYKQASNANVNVTVPSVFFPQAGVPTTIINGHAYGGFINHTLTYQDATGTTATPHLTTLTNNDIKSIDTKCAGLGLCPQGNGIDPSILSADGKSGYLAQYPLANTSGGDTYNTGVYQFVSPNPISQITNIARLDYNLSSKHILFVRGNLQSDNASSTLTIPGAVPGGRSYFNNKGIAVGHIWTISNSMTNNLRYGLVRSGVSTAGTGGTPHTTVPGITSLASTQTSSAYTEPVHNIADDFTWVKGRHTIQAGVNNRYVFNNRYSNSTLFPTGSASAAQLTVAGICGLKTTLDPTIAGLPNCSSAGRSAYNTAILALTGVVTNVSQFINYDLKGSVATALSGSVPVRHFHSAEQEYYVQDQWKAGRHFTVTAGLRYAYYGTPYETGGQEIAPTVSMDTKLAKRVAAASSGAAAYSGAAAFNDYVVYDIAGKANGRPDFWAPQKLNFAPRIAFAWASLDNKTSVRGGYALAYDHFGDSIVDSYDSSGGFKLNRSYGTAFGSIDASPRFTGFYNVPAPALTTAQLAPITFPYAPETIAPVGGYAPSFNFTTNINSKQPTPYGETVNLTVQREVTRGLTVTASYVGRFGRHLLESLDAGAPSNVYDPVSGMDYFTAMAILDKQADAGVTPDNVAMPAYFQNLFPNYPTQSFTQTVAGKSVTTPYTGPKALYTRLINSDRGNETDIIYNDDACPSSLVANQCTSTFTADQAKFGKYRFFNPQYGSIFNLTGTGTSNYNSGQLSMRHVVNKTFQYDVNYTFSKSMDMGSAPESAGGNTIQNSFNQKGDYGVSDFDIRHNVTADYIVTLPFGHGQRFFNHTNGIVDRVIGGWQITGIVKSLSALPLNPSGDGNHYGTNFAASTRPILTGAAPAVGNHRYFATAAGGPQETFLKTLTSSQASALFRFAYPGEAASRNYLRGDSYFDMDNGIAKSFRTFREQSFRIEIEYFNVLNSVRFSGGTSSFTSTTFGKYASLATSPRQAQISGKYTF